MKNIDEENIQRIDFIKQYKFCDFILINRQSNKKSMIPHTLRRWMRLVGVIFVIALSLWLS